MLRTLPVCLALLFASQGVSAGVIEQELSMPVTIEHDSNPTLSNLNKQSVTRTIATPRYKITSGDGVKEMSANLALSIERTSDQTVRPDREDPSISLKWKTDLPLGVLSAGANYDETSILTSELAETGLIQTEGTRRNQALNAGYMHLLSDRLNMSFNSGYTRVMYSGGTQTNYRLPSASAILNYQYSEVLSPFVQVSFSRYLPDDRQPSTDYLSVTTGAAWQWSARTDLTFNVGINSIKSQQNDTGFQGEVKLKHAYERFTTTAGLARTISPSGNGGFIESDSLQAGIMYGLSNRSGVGSDVLFRKNNGRNKSEYDQFNLFYQYEITPQWDMRVNTQFKYRKDEADSSANAKVFGFTVNYIHPKF